MKTQRIAVVFGGNSPDHWTSFSSGLFALLSLDPARYLAQAIYVDQDGRFASGDAFRAALEAFLVSPSGAGFAKSQNGSEWQNDIPSSVNTQPERFLATMGDDDHILPFLLSRGGGNGALQALAYRQGNHAAGRFFAASALGQDKILAKRMAVHHGLTVAPWREVTHTQWRSSRAWLLESLPRDLGWPLSVKPARMGSSTGVGRALDPQSLEDSLVRALDFDNLVLVEAEAAGPHYGVGLVGSPGQYQTSVPYATDTHNHSTAFLRAATSDSETQELQALARDVGAMFGLRGMACVELLPGQRGPVFSEYQPAPAFWPQSPLVRGFNDAGISPRELLDRLVALA